VFGDSDLLDNASIDWIAVFICLSIIIDLNSHMARIPANHSTNTHRANIVAATRERISTCLDRDDRDVAILEETVREIEEERLSSLVHIGVQC
jgi:hypothetical protein